MINHHYNFLLTPWVSRGLQGMGGEGISVVPLTGEGDRVNLIVKQFKSFSPFLLHPSPSPVINTDCSPLLISVIHKRC